MKSTETKRIKTDYPGALKQYEDFCGHNNIEVSLPYPNPTTGKEMFINATKMIADIKEVGNGGIIPNALDGNQDKHYPWFKKNTSGSGLSYCDCDYWVAYSLVPARLCSLDSGNVEPDANKYNLIYDLLNS